MLSRKACIICVVSILLVIVVYFCYRRNDVDYELLDTKDFMITLKDKELTSKFEFVDVELKWLSVINPSIIRLGSDMLVVSRISTFHNCSHLPKIYPYISSIVVSKISGCNIDTPAQVISKPFKVMKFPYSDSDIFAWGLEDPRVFIWRGDVYIIANSKNNQGGSDTYLAKLSSNLQEYERVWKVKPTFDIKNKHQKNWNPFIVREHEPLFTTSIEPHNIAKINMINGQADLLYSTSSTVLKDRYPGPYSLRGGTRTIETKNGYLGICHLYRNHRYTHLFYLTEKDPPYRIVNYSNPFCIPNPDCHRIQFISGLEKVENDLWISYGNMDCTTHITVIPYLYALELVSKNSTLE